MPCRLQFLILSDSARFSSSSMSRMQATTVSRVWVHDGPSDVSKPHCHSCTRRTGLGHQRSNLCCAFSDGILSDLMRWQMAEVSNRVTLHGFHFRWDQYTAWRLAVCCNETADAQALSIRRAAILRRREWLQEATRLTRLASRRPRTTRPLFFCRPGEHRRLSTLQPTLGPEGCNIPLRGDPGSRRT